MIPILYDKNETAFASNGLGRLRDCISCVVTEERNGIYECDFEYPITGAHYNEIQLGRIIGVTHEDYLLTREVRTRAPLTDEEDDNLTDEEGLSLTAARTKTIPERDIQPFDIVSFSKPINGVVTFHCVHISYRQSYMTVTGSGISSLADAFTLLATAEPDNPFTYWTDMSSSAYMACADGLPKTVRSMLGGVEGSILDTYGGEYEWDRFTVKLWSSRGTDRNFTIRYGVNMLTYDDETDAQGTYSSCIPYWTDGTNTVIGDRVDSYGSTVTGRGECVPLDLSDKFETQPTKAQVEAEALSQMSAKNPFLASQTINVSFVRLQDMGEYENLSSLLQCRLCDTVKVMFHDYGTTGRFKIVKTVWNVLLDRFESMELGTLSTTLAQALGIDNNFGSVAGKSADYVMEEGTSGIWNYRKWANGTAECWALNAQVYQITNGYGTDEYYTTDSVNFPASMFTEAPRLNATRQGQEGAGLIFISPYAVTKDYVSYFIVNAGGAYANAPVGVALYAIGKWK